MLPAGVEPQVWNLADGDRIAFENLSDLLIGRHFRQSIVCHAGGPEATVEALPERTMGLHWAVRPNAEPLEVGLTADAFRVLDQQRPRAVSLRDAAGAARGRARATGGGAARRLPA